MNVADRTLARFASVMGGEPDGVWFAPGRVNLIGEHVDYSAGLCLPIALAQRTVAAARPREDGRIRLASCELDQVIEVTLDEVAPGEPAGWGLYAFGVLWAMREAGMDVGGVDLVVGSDVPLGAGLSSSAALSCSVGAAASDLFGLGLLGDDAGRRTLVDLCRRAENDIALAPTGGLDQTASLRAREGHALLIDCRDFSVDHAPFDLASHGLTLLVVDTRAHHALADGQYGRRRAACERAAAELGVSTLREVPFDGLQDALARLTDDELVRRTRHVVTEIQRVRQASDALSQHDYPALGDLFWASHASLRDDFEVSCAELDAVVDVARAQGALGARMTGGGFGGSAIALLDADRVEPFSRAVRDAFAAQGWDAPRVFTAEAGAPAGRLA